MAIRNILLDGDPILRKKSRNVTTIDERTVKLLEDLRDTLKERDGVGLAAVQVGILKRLAVIDAGEDLGVIELINPEIIHREGEQEFFEGCLSYPGMYGDVGRPFEVVARTLNRKGATVLYKAVGMYAVCFCHEIDHTNGIMFTDKLRGRLYSTEELRQRREGGRNESRRRGMSRPETAPGDVASQKETSSGDSDGSSGEDGGVEYLGEES